MLSVSRSGARARPRGPTPPQPVVPDWIFVSTSYIPPEVTTCFGSVRPSWKGAALGEGALLGKCRLRNPVAGGALGRNPSARARHAPPTAGFTTLGPAGAEGLDDRPPGRARLPGRDRAPEVGRGPGRHARGPGRGETARGGAGGRGLDQGRRSSASVQRRTTVAPGSTMLPDSSSTVTSSEALSPHSASLSGRRTEAGSGESDEGDAPRKPVPLQVRRFPLPSCHPSPSRRFAGLRPPGNRWPSFSSGRRIARTLPL